MPWNGSGIFTRGYSWVNDASNAIPITASRMDADTNDIVSNGLNNCITRDGQGGPTANLPMNGFRHTGASNGVAASDYATMGQIAGFAPLASPTFTGVPTVPTPGVTSNTTQIANTAYVKNNLVNYALLAGSTFTGAVSINETSSQFNLSLFNTGGNGAGILFSGNGGVTPSKIIRARAGNLEIINDANNAVLASMTDAGSWSFGSASFSSTVGISGALSANNTFSYGGITQPHVFVQSAQPTAIAVGDLWFW
jgi:hypothetical protein